MSQSSDDQYYGIEEYLDNSDILGENEKFNISFPTSTKPLVDQKIYEQESEKTDERKEIPKCSPVDADVKPVEQNEESEKEPDDIVQIEKEIEKQLQESDVQSKPIQTKEMKD